jgi:hypothetical protein
MVVLSKEAALEEGLGWKGTQPGGEVWVKKGRRSR